MSAPARIFKVENQLAKVVKTQGGKTVDEHVKAAEVRIEGVRDVTLAALIQKADAMAAIAAAGKKGADPKAFDSLYDISNAIFGLAGAFGLKALEPKWITNRQIEAARQAMTRHMKREGSVWIRIFPDKPITRKPAEVRMGKGKGNLEFWAAVVKPGLIMFEVEGVPQQLAQEALELAAQKLPIKTKFVVRHDYAGA